jgi:hypothetical protein
MIVGTIIQRRFPRSGRVLVSAGAIALSYWALVACALVLDGTISRDRPVEVGLTLASVLLVAFCDVAIVIEEVKIRRVQIEQKAEIVPLSKNIRWLAGATGCVTGLIFFFDWGIGFVSVFLIVGALLAGRFPQSGKELTWFGAGVVSLSILPLSGWFLFHAFDGTGPWVTAGSAASVLFIVLCDAALMVEVISRKRSRSRPKS